MLSAPMTTSPSLGPRDSGPSPGADRSRSAPWAKVWPPGPSAGVLLLLTLSVADAVTAVHAVLSPLFTAAQTVLVVPWLHAVMPAASVERSRRRRLETLAINSVVVAVVVACLASKWAALGWPAGEPRDHAAAYRLYTAFGAVTAAVGLLGREARLARLLVAMADQPARLLVGSFALASLLGGFVLTLPVSVRRLGEASFVDALFMATSAVCVTGLAVHDVARTYTPFGQGVLLVLIQAGGLGIMVLSTFIVVVAGRRLRVRSAAVMAEAIDAESLASLRRAVVTIVMTTLAVESLGAAGLYLAFSRHAEVAHGTESVAPLSGAGSVLWAAVFHAVSAFCNAGFSLFQANLVPLAGDAAVNGTVGLLVLLGGLGFPVLAELGRHAAARARGQRPPRLSLHARTVLASSAALVALLAAAIMVLEWDSSLGHLSGPQRIMAALFQSLSARTAGFNTVDIGAMRPATWLLVCAFMFVGASPGSTGGGIKTSTFVALAASLRALVRGDSDTRLFDRVLPPAVVHRAIGVTFLSGLLAASLAFLLLLTEVGEPARLVFEVVSAFGTVGFSTGITPALSDGGRLVLVVAMIVGRVGPLTMTLALAGRQRSNPVRPVEERVLIG
jgi:trk system potassium uptake protein TrkH